MDTKVTFANGVTYRTHDALCSAAGSVGVANIRVLLAEFEGRIDAWGLRQLHDEVRGVATKRIKQLRTPVFAHRLPTEDCLLVTDALGSESIYLRCGTAQEGVIDALDDYLAIDDTTVSEVEDEWHKEAWPTWIRTALLQTMKDTTLRDWADDYMDEDLLWDSYLRALDMAGAYPELERRDVVIDVKQITTAFTQILRAEAEAERDRSIEPRRLHDD